MMTKMWVQMLVVLALCASCQAIVDDDDDMGGEDPSETANGVGILRSIKACVSRGCKSREMKSLVERYTNFLCESIGGCDSGFVDDSAREFVAQAQSGSRSLCNTFGGCGRSLNVNFLSACPPGGCEGDGEAFQHRPKYPPRFGRSVGKPDGSPLAELLRKR